MVSKISTPETPGHSNWLNGSRVFQLTPLSCTFPLFTSRVKISLGRWEDENTYSMCHLRLLHGISNLASDRQFSLRPHLRFREVEETRVETSEGLSFYWRTGKKRTPYPNWVQSQQTPSLWKSHLSCSDTTRWTTLRDYWYLITISSSGVPPTPALLS